jgi:hypothetical protein
MLETFFDHRNFYINDKPFYPVISSDIKDKNANAIVISIDCSNKSALNFEKQIEIANIINSQNQYIVWDIHVGLEDSKFPIQDELILRSILHSIKYFIANVYTQYQDISIGVILYTGSVPNFNLNDDSFKNWLNNLPTQQKNEFDPLYLKQLFNCDLLVDYLRLIAPNIPDEVSMIIRLDVSEIINYSKLIHLLSKERFEYFLLALKGAKLSTPVLKWGKGEGELGSIDSQVNDNLKIPSNIGVCFSNLKKMTKKEFLEFDSIFEKLLSLKINFRILEETYATEQWDELDYIIARKNSLSQIGYRMLQGFYAAAGITIYHDMPIGITDEISFKEFLKFKP